MSRTEEWILAGILFLAALFILFAQIWGTSRSHSQRAFLAFIGLLLCIPVIIFTQLALHGR